MSNLTSPVSENGSLMPDKNCVQLTRVTLYENPMAAVEKPIITNCRTPVATAADGNGEVRDKLLSESPSGETDAPSKKGNGVPVDDPHIKRITNSETMMHILKCNIGTGILAMPEALKNAGLLLGTFGLGLMGVIAIHCMHQLSKTTDVLTAKSGMFTTDYAICSEMAFKLGPPKMRKFAPVARFLTNLFLCLAQLGICCVYFSFASQNIKQVVEYYVDINWPYQLYMVMLLIPLILINFIRNLKYLAPCSTIANVLQSTALLLCLYYLLLCGVPPASERKAIATMDTIPLFFGTAVFAYGGITLLLPLKRDMETPQDLGGSTGVLNQSMIIVTLVYVSIGFFGYLKYGEITAGSITLNLTRGEILAEIVRLAYAVAVFLSYAIQFYVPISIVWPFFKSKISGSKKQVFFELVFRTVLVLLTFALAALVPSIGLFISLVGAMATSYLALILPPVLETVTFWSDLPWWGWTKNILILILGLLGLTVGTYLSLYNIVTEFTKSTLATNGTVPIETSNTTSISTAPCICLQWNNSTCSTF